MTGPSFLPDIQTMMAETTPALLLAKAIGALAGSLISIAYVLPRGRREAFLRLLVGMVSGLVFGSTVGIKIADALGVLGKISLIETMLMGASVASLCAWWGLGVLHRISERLPDKFENRPIYPAFNRKARRKEAPK